MIYEYLHSSPFSNPSSPNPHKFLSVKFIEDIFSEFCGKFPKSSENLKLSTVISIYLWMDSISGRVWISDFEPTDTESLVKSVQIDSFSDWGDFKNSSNLLFLAFKNNIAHIPCPNDSTRIFTGQLNLYPSQLNEIDPVSIEWDEGKPQLLLNAFEMT